jgi:hypothetical protein
MFPNLFECKDCGGFTGYRSRPKNLTERFLLPLLLFTPDPLRRLFQADVPVSIREGSPTAGIQEGTGRGCLSVESLLETL